MARVTYAALGLAFAALVGGFFIRTSSVPLIASIGLSAVVSVLILAGWTRRMRREGLGEGFEDAEEVQVQDIEMIEVEPEASVSVGASARERLKKKVGARPVRDGTREQTAVIPVTKPKRPRPASKPRPAMALSKPKPVSAGRAARGGSRTATRTRSKRVFVIPGRERYHAADCRYATGDDLREVTEALAKRRGYTPCGLCLRKK